MASKEKAPELTYFIMFSSTYKPNNHSLSSLFLKNNRKHTWMPEVIYPSLVLFHLRAFQAPNKPKKEKSKTNKEVKYQPPRYHSAYHQQLEVSHIHNKEYLSPFLPPLQVLFVPSWWGRWIRVITNVKLRAKLTKKGTVPQNNIRNCTDTLPSCL